MKADVVFSGGGVRAIGIIGALSYMENKGFSWMKAAGTSAGAIIAALVSAGYTANEIKKILIDMKFLNFLDKEKITRMPVLGKSIAVLKYKGVYKGDFFENWMAHLLKDKGIETFGDLYVDGDYRLKIIASDITRKKKIVIPEDLLMYDLDINNFSVAKAVRMSMSIPLYFKPIKILYKDKISYIVDGCICDNFPIEIFDVEEIPRWPTLGFCFNDEEDVITSKDNISCISFLYDIAGTMNESMRNKWYEIKNSIRTIYIPTCGIKATDFNLSKKSSLKLYKEGYKSARNFYKSWDFEKYTDNYRKKLG